MVPCVGHLQDCVGCGFGSEDLWYARGCRYRGAEYAVGRHGREPEGLAGATMHLNYKRRTRPDERRQVLKARIRSRFSVLDKTDCDECILRCYRIFNHQIEVAGWTVGWNRIMGGDLRTLHEHEGAPHADRALPRMNGAIIVRTGVVGTSDERSAGTSHPCDRHSRGSRQVQTMLPQRGETRRSLNQSFDCAGKPEVTAGAGLSTPGRRATHQLG